jgi:hypothetical protein
MAAGLAYILKGEAATNQLFLFTSKRYNLALLGYGLCQLAVVNLAGKVPGGPLFVFGPILATISGLQGYVYGVRGWDYQKKSTTIAADLKTAVTQLVRSFVKLPKTFSSVVYLVATLMLATMKLAKAKEIVEILSTGGGDMSKILVPLARFGRLALFASVVYSLKDGADRGILDGKGFIQLNFLSAVSFAALAAYAGPTTNPIGGLSAFFALVCAFNGLASTLNKERL